MELVRSIVALGQNMNMKIVAEGVETAEEAEALKNLGCERVQGYYYSRPHSEKEITDKLIAWHHEGRIR